jgi:hypothetical protein
MTYPVTVWDARDYTGSTKANIDYGTYSNVTKIGMPNDSISSIKVAPFTKVTLYDDAYYRGNKISFTGPKNIPRLGDYDSGWEDIITSIKVERVEPPIATQLSCCQGTTAATSCGEYKPNSARCNSVLGTYCADAAHLGEQRCRTYCRANTAQCDTAVVAYCAANPTDPFCTCLMSPASTKGLINPKCVDRKCLDTGYITTSMGATACPSQVTCAINTALTNSGVILSNTVPVQQNCGNTTTPPYVPPVILTPTGPVVTSPGTTTGPVVTNPGTTTGPVVTNPGTVTPGGGNPALPPAVINTSNSSWNMLMVFLFLVLVLAVLIIIRRRRAAAAAASPPVTA